MEHPDDDDYDDFGMFDDWHGMVGLAGVFIVSVAMWTGIVWLISKAIE